MEKNIGLKIKVLREGLGMNQEELANKVDISRTYLSEIERGHKNPSLDLLERLSLVLETSLSNLRGINVMNEITIPVGLKEFALKKKLPMDEVLELSTVRFRGNTPQTEKEWKDIYDILNRVLG